MRWLVDETDVEMVVPDAGGETLLHHAAFHGKVYQHQHALCTLVALCLPVGFHFGVAARQSEEL